MARAKKWHFSVFPIKNTHKKVVLQKHGELPPLNLNSHDQTKIFLNFQTHLLITKYVLTVSPIDIF